MVNWAGAWAGFENRESESLGFESSAIRMNYNADSIIRQNRMEIVPKLLPFVSIKWALEKMGLTMGEITACDESLRREFIKKIGVTDVEPVNKFSIKKSDVGEDMKVVVMSSA